jgi:hypothetical protein
MNNADTIRLIINELVIEKKLSKVALSEQSGHGRPKIDGMLSGRSEVTVDLILALCELTGKKPSYFFGEEVQNVDNEQLLDRIEKLSMMLGEERAKYNKNINKTDK